MEQIVIGEIRDAQIYAIKSAMSEIWEISNRLMNVGIDTLTNENLTKDYVTNLALDAHDMLDGLYFQLADLITE